jgi:hypothetical protein
MVPLPAATVVENRGSAVCVPHGGKTSRYLSNCRVPIDLLEAAVFPTTERRGDSVRPVLIVVEAVGLLTSVALGGGVRFVPSNSSEVALSLTAQLHLETAIALTENARCFIPGLGHAATSFFLDPMLTRLS